MSLAPAPGRDFLIVRPAIIGQNGIVDYLTPSIARVTPGSQGGDQRTDVERLRDDVFDSTQALAKRTTSAFSAQQEELLARAEGFQGRAELGLRAAVSESDLLSVKTSLAVVLASGLGDAQYAESNRHLFGEDERLRSILAKVSRWSSLGLDEEAITRFYQIYAAGGSPVEPGYISLISQRAARVQPDLDPGIRAAVAEDLRTNGHAALDPAGAAWLPEMADMAKTNGDSTTDQKVLKDAAREIEHALKRASKHDVSQSGSQIPRSNTLKPC